MKRRQALVLPALLQGTSMQAQPAQPAVAAVMFPLPVAGRSGGALTAFRDRLAGMGWVEGRSLTLDVHVYEMPAERLAAQVAAALARGPDVIVAGTPLSARLAKAATRTVPIVVAVGGDPVADGLVPSLARPGGNITGLSLMAPELNGRRLQLLVEIVPGLRRAGILVPRGIPRLLADLRDYEDAARRLGIEMLQLDVDGPDEFGAALQAARRQGVQGLVLPQSPLLFAHSAHLAALTLEHRMPAVAGSGDDAFARAGGLVNYGASILALWRRAAGYVDQVLRGKKPADLPMQQPDRFELVINRRTAETLGLVIPPHLLVLADEVIR